MFNRRNFLKGTALGAGSLVAWGLDVPGFLSRTAGKTIDSGKRGGKDTILVVVQLSGGNDGLNTVIPYKNDLYEQYRPTLKQSKDSILKLNDELALHPSMKDFADLYQNKKLCVVQGVGYPNPNQSHFTSMDIWHTANLVDQRGDGWLGKAMARMPAAGGMGFHLAESNEPVPLAVAGAPVKVPSLHKLEEFRLNQVYGTGSEKQEQRKLIEASAAPTGKPGLLDFVQRTTVSTLSTTKRLADIAKNYTPKVPYPASGLANRLKMAAQLIDAELGARIYYVSIDGFDTHANQADAHAKLLEEVSSSVAAFYRDISARGHGDRVTVMTFSEFGRRAKENGSKGTDHGSAAPMFLLGNGVAHGIIGEHPKLEKLDDGNLVHALDFRSVYANLLDGWLGVDSKEVLGAAFKPVKVIS